MKHLAFVTAAFAVSLTFAGCGSASSGDGPQSGGSEVSSSSVSSSASSGASSSSLSGIDYSAIGSVDLWDYFGAFDGNITYRWDGAEAPVIKNGGSMSTDRTKIVTVNGGSYLQQFVRMGENDAALVGGPGGSREIVRFTRNASALVIRDYSPVGHRYSGKAFDGSGLEGLEPLVLPRYIDPDTPLMQKEYTDPNGIHHRSVCFVRNLDGDSLRLECSKNRSDADGEKIYYANLSYEITHGELFQFGAGEYIRMPEGNWIRRYDSLRKSESPASNTDMMARNRAAADRPDYHAVDLWEFMRGRISNRSMVRVDVEDAHHYPNSGDNPDLPMTDPVTTGVDRRVYLWRYSDIGENASGRYVLPENNFSSVYQVQRMPNYIEFWDNTAIGKAWQTPRGAGHFRFAPTADISGVMLQRDFTKDGTWYIQQCRLDFVYQIPGDTFSAAIDIKCRQQENHDMDGDVQLTFREFTYSFDERRGLYEVLMNITEQQGPNDFVRKRTRFIIDDTRIGEDGNITFPQP